MAIMPLVEGLSQSDRQQLMNFLAEQQVVKQRQIFIRCGRPMIPLKQQTF